MKRAKKGLAALLSICMLVTFIPASALALGPEVGEEGSNEEAVAPVEEETEPVGEPAEPDNGAYSALKQAIEAASDGKETTVTLAGDIAGMTTEQIITIPENKNIILDMEGHSITVASDFTGRPIVNKGTLTVTGNGTIMVLLLVYKGLFPHRQAIRKCGTASLKPWHAISTPMVVLRSMHCTLRENPVR